MAFELRFNKHAGELSRLRCATHTEQCTWYFSGKRRKMAKMWILFWSIDSVAATCAGHELGGSAPHQCRWAVVVWVARCRDGVMSCCRLWLFCAYPSFLVERISLNGGGTTTSRGEVRSFRDVKSGFSRSRCSAVVPGVLACVHMYILYVCVYMCVCMCVYEHA